MIDLGINVGGSGNNWIAYKPRDDRWDYPPPDTIGESLIAVMCQVASYPVPLS